MTLQHWRRLFVILSAAKDLKLSIRRSFAVFAAQDDEIGTAALRAQPAAGRMSQPATGDRRPATAGVAR